MAYRLGLDIGTNSIGWCALVLSQDERPQPCGLLDMGVRIYSDGRNPKDKTSLAVQRRVPRSMRRRRDRYLNRRGGLMTALVELGLMPADAAARKALEACDPYALRAAALDRALVPEELGRALFHLDQRRGFRSNRKTDSGDAKETGLVKAGVGELERRMAESGARTLGEFLHRRLAKGKPVRVRPETGLYPSRAMYEAEFDAIQAAQAPHHPRLTEADWLRLRAIVFHQRPLRPVDPGRCTLIPTEKRAPRALPLAQRFRMVQEVANLKVLQRGQTARTLTPEERAILLAQLARRKEVKFANLPKLLRLDGDPAFNLWDEKRIALKGDETAQALARKDRFGPHWFDLPPERRDAIVERLLSDDDEDVLIAEAKADWGLDEAAAAAVVGATLPDGHARLGRTALSRIVPILEEQGLRYDEAVQEAGFDHHSDFCPGDRPTLPYYGEALSRHVVGGGKAEGNDADRHGRIGNPTVHIGLNQIRRLVNRLIAAYGKPDQIVVELARELKLSEDKKRDIRERQARETRANERLRADIEAAGRTPSDDLLRRLRLWEEQGEPQARLCPYSGQPISFAMAVDDHQTDIDHILPFSRSLDDSPANKVLCLRAANRAKGNRTPFDAFGASPAVGGIRYDYAGILLRADKLPPNKRWRFHPDALEKLEREGRDFLDRQLNETRHLSRVTREYLTHVCGNVWVLPGTLTAMIRGRLGLNRMLGDDNRKNRDDHRHHALDAVVTALTDRSLLQAVATAAGRSEHRLIDDMPEPPAWPDFREDVRSRIATLVVSHKPDHGTPGVGGGTSGALHNDTAYGLVAPPDAKGMSTVVTSKPLAALKPAGLTPESIRDPVLARRLAALWAEIEGAGGKWPDFVKAAAEPGRVARFGIRSVRVLERMSGLVTIADTAGRPYKAYKADGNAYMDIFRLPNGRWKGETVRVFDANQPGFAPQWRRAIPEATVVARLHIDDMVAIGIDTERRVLRVVKLSGQKITLADHCEAGALKARHENSDDPFEYVEKSPNTLRQMGFRPLRVDEIGRVADPGPLP